MKKETACVHSGSYHDSATSGLNSPIFTSSAYAYLDRETVVYPRYFNTPNQQAVVKKLCALEMAADGVLFSSGMAAISTTMLACAHAGEHVVLQDELYGGTHAFVTGQFARLGIDYTFTATDAASICAALTDQTRLIVIETPTNPLLSVLDIRQVAACARERGILTMLDNTFASPIYQNPLTLGVDIVVHSGTKYLGGHSDLCCGVALTSAPLAERIRAVARNLGGSLDANTSYLLERSLKTLGVRVERQTANAGRIAAFLHEHPRVRQVYYPGLPDHPGHALARAQMSGYGAMLSFDVVQEQINAQDMLRRLQMITPAVSLGGVESTICAPVATSHAKMSPTERAQIGITDSLLRLSVGIEHVDDLIADLEQALAGPERA